MFKNTVCCFLLCRFKFFTVLTVFVALLWWFALRGHRPSSRERMVHALCGGCLLGALGGVGGFLGPLFWDPGANQGPLLGIVVTGPAGFGIGALLGAFFKELAPPQRGR